jgi:putative mRNA 3-end processing factor
LALIEFTKNGIYCPIADVYIDPWKPVKKALITHGHSDHARYGSKHYIATRNAVPVIKHRLGSHIDIAGVDYGENILVNGVNFSFHPAGHIIGSAQIRVDYRGEIWVISGDYKTSPDGISESFEPVKCHHFITECTFGLPVFRWDEEQPIIDRIKEWWQKNANENSPSIIGSYSLGKAQRLIYHLAGDIGPIYTHGAVENVNEVIRKQGFKLPETTKLLQVSKNNDLCKSLIIAPPSAVNSAWADKIKNARTAMASGWMAVRGIRRRRAMDTGFVMSDHADWPGLLSAIEATGAENIYTTHGYTEIFAKYLSENGYNAKVVKTEFGEEEEAI